MARDLQQELDSLKGEFDSLKTALTQRLGTNLYAQIRSDPFTTPIRDFEILSQTIKLVNVVWTDNTPGAGRVTWSNGQVIYLGNTYDVLTSSCDVGEPYIFWQLALPFFFQSSANVPVLGDDDFLVAYNRNGAHSLVWNKSGITEALFTVENFPFVTNITFGDNSPGAGRVDWSAGFVVYKGIAYATLTGNCLSTDSFITWDVAASNVLVGSAAMPILAEDAFLIALNDGGTHRVAWNKTAPQGPVGVRSFLVLYSGASNKMVEVAKTGATPSGIVRVYDGSGAGGIGGNGEAMVFDGNTKKTSLQGVLNLNGASIVGAAGASAGYVVVQIAGVDQKIQVYAT